MGSIWVFYQVPVSPMVAHQITISQYFFLLLSQNGRSDNHLIFAYFLGSDYLIKYYSCDILSVMWGMLWETPATFANIRTTTTNLQINLILPIFSFFHAAAFLSQFQPFFLLKKASFSLRGLPSNLLIPFESFGREPVMMLNTQKLCGWNFQFILCTTNTELGRTEMYLSKRKY